MRLSLSVALILASLVVTSLSAHVMVSPPQSKSGATQKYEMRVHNESKLASASIELDIPDGITVLNVAKPATGTYATEQTGTRITRITWQVEVQPNKYVALPFTARNPDGEKDLHWNVRQHMADGSVVDWSDKPGAKEKASVTKLTAPAAPVIDRKQ